MNASKSTILEPVTLSDTLKPAKRCPDFDHDCFEVEDHLQCWKGLKAERGGTTYYTGQAEGYCPFVIGMIRKDD